MKDGPAVSMSPSPPQEATDDAPWVAATLAGDLRAFDRLIERYQRRAVSVAYRLLGNMADAADVCQDAFLKAYRSLDTLEEPRRFGAWLMRIVSNLSLNFRRARHRNPLSLLSEDRREADAGEETTAAAVASGGPGPEESVLSGELERAIGRAVERLPEKQRLALVLFAIEGLPQKEVADILEISIELVKWNVFQARKKLREELAEYLTE